jgi:hypothetical protein
MIIIFIKYLNTGKKLFILIFRFGPYCDISPLVA